MPKSLHSFRRDEPQQLTAKHFLIDRMTQRLFILAIVIVLAGLAFAGFGVVLVLAGGEEGKSVIRLFGQEVTTDSVGVACIAIGAIVIVVVVRRILRSWEKMTK